MSEVATTRYRAITPDEARGFMEERHEGDYSLVDVREDWEYEEFHLPGARLVPLARLVERLPELDPSKPTLVYCASGKRSAAAASILAGQGFSDVANIQGGAMAWRGQTADGPEDFGLIHFRGDESPRAILRLAYRMEGTLAELYERLAAQTASRELADLLGVLSSFEFGHQRLVFEAYRRIDSSVPDMAAFERDLSFDVLEGAVSAEEFLAAHADDLKSAFGVIDMAMAIEAQAMDLYMRASRRETDEESKRILMELAEAEKSHVTDLARILSRR